MTPVSRRCRHSSPPSANPPSPATRNVMVPPATSAAITRGCGTGGRPAGPSGRCPSENTWPNGTTTAITAQAAHSAAMTAACEFGGRRAGGARHARSHTSSDDSASRSRGAVPRRHARPTRLICIVNYVNCWTWLQQPTGRGPVEVVSPAPTGCHPADPDALPWAQAACCRPSTTAARPASPDLAALDNCSQPTMTTQVRRPEDAGLVADRRPGRCACRAHRITEDGHVAHGAGSRRPRDRHRPGDRTTRRRRPETLRCHRRHAPPSNNVSNA